MEWIIFILILYFILLDIDKEPNNKNLKLKNVDIENDSIDINLDKKDEVLYQEIEELFNIDNNTLLNSNDLKLKKELKAKIENDSIDINLDKKEINKSYKYLYKNIIPYLKSKNIHKFYHFTDERNLKSIIMHGGLYSWYGLQKMKIHSYLSSNQLSRNLDVKYKLENYVRLSYVNYHPMSSRVMYQEHKKIVWLEISLEVACLKETLFSNMNATDNNVLIGDDLDFLKTIDFNVFRYNYKDLDYKGKKRYQAEILVKDFIPIDYITNINTLYKEKNL